MYKYPKQAAYNKVLPKSKIYEQARPGRAVRDCFVKQIDQIVWKYVLATRTINLPVRKPVEEIAIIEISLKTKDVNEEVLRTIDKAVPVPIFYVLRFKDQIKSIAAYKRPRESLKDQVERMMQIRSKEIECRKLESRINKEKQFNRKVEINVEQIFKLISPGTEVKVI